MERLDGEYDDPATAAANVLREFGLSDIEIVRNALHDGDPDWH